MSYTFQMLVRRADYAEYVTGGKTVLSWCNRATEAGTDAMNPATLQQAPDNRRLRISLGLRLNQRKIGHIPQTKIRVTVFMQKIHRVLRLPFTCCFGFCIKQISYVRFWDKSQYPSRIDARHRVLQRKRCQLIIDIAVKDDHTRIALSRSPHHTPKIKSIQKIQS